MQMNFNQFASSFQGFMRNPMQMLTQKKLNIPQNIQNNPQAIVQHLMNSGQMSQQQFNQLQSMAKQIQGNPQFMQIFKK